MSATMSVRCRFPLRLLCAAALLPGALAAQQAAPPAVPPVAPAPAPAQPTPMPAAAGDTNEVLVIARGADTVRMERDRLLSERRDIEGRWAQLREESGRLRSNLADVRAAIDAAGDREKAAKKEKRETDRALFLSEKRALERSRDILESRFDLRQAQVELARLQRDYTDAAIRAADAELAIAERRLQVLPDDASQRGPFQELTNRWLQAIRTRTARAYDVEDRRYKVTEAQLEVLKRQRS
jgi:chromosome segregation ATPase